MSSQNKFNVPSQGYYFCTGCKTTVTWKPTTQGTVTIELMNMSKSSIGTVIAQSIPNDGEFTYTPRADIDSGVTYMMEIVDDNNPDIRSYSPEFAIVNLKAATNTMTRNDMPSSTAMASMSGMASMSSGMPSSTSTVSAGSLNQHGLSHGAYAGIGVGTAVIVLIIAGLAFFLGRRTLAKRRRSLDEPADQKKSMERSQDSVVEQPQMDSMEPMRHVSITRDFAHELDAQQEPRPKMSHRISELPSGTTHIPEMEDTSPNTTPATTPGFWDKKKFNPFSSD